MLHNDAHQNQNQNQLWLSCLQNDYYKCWVLMTKVWEVWLEMQHHGWKRMKIYNKWFNLLILYMHNDWKWHGMTKLGIENPLKQPKQKSWKSYWISMNPKWFMGNKKCIYTLNFFWFVLFHLRHVKVSFGGFCVFIKFKAQQNRSLLQR